MDLTLLARNYDRTMALLDGALGMRGVPRPVTSPREFEQLMKRLDALNVSDPSD